MVFKDHSDKVNTLWNSFSFIILSVLGFINFSLNIKSYDVNLFGLFILLNSFFAIGSSIDFGFGVSTVKHVAEACSLGDVKLINSIFVSFIIVYSCFALTIASVLGVYYIFFLKNVDSVLFFQNLNINLIFLFLTLTFIVRYVNNFLNRFFEGMGKFVLISKINISIAIINTLFMLAIFIFKLHIFYLSFFLFLNSIFLFIALILKSNDYIEFKLKNFSYSLIKKYALYSFNLQLSFFINSFIDPSVKFVISNLLGLNYVTYFETGKKIIDLTNGLIFSAQKGVLNKISEANLLGRMRNFAKDEIYVYSKMSNYYSIFVYGFFNPLICLFVLMWFGSFESMIILLIFFLPYSLINFAGCLYQIFMVEGKGVRLLIMQTLNVLLTVLFLYLSLIYLGNYLGLLGFYFATIVSIFIIFYFLRKSNYVQVYNYLVVTKFKDIVLLSIILLSELILLYYFKEYYLLILAVYFIVYGIVFYKYWIYVSKKIYYKIKNMKSWDNLINGDV